VDEAIQLSQRNGVLDAFELAFIATLARADGALSDSELTTLEGALSGESSGSTALARYELDLIRRMEEGGTLTHADALRFVEIAREQSKAGVSDRASRAAWHLLAMFGARMEPAARQIFEVLAMEPGTPNPDGDDMGLY
jgi:hypothetical protein